MIKKVDWISFSVGIGEGKDRGLLETASLAWAAVSELGDGYSEHLGMVLAPIAGKGRAPYSHSFSWHDNGLTMFVHPTLPHALIEISGKGCERIFSLFSIAEILQPIQPRITRLDVACDMNTITHPIPFCAKREEGRFTSRSEVVSDSGETVYIGSKSSNRYARVYRYNPPHERSHLLRCEFVVKAEDARSTAQTIIDEGLDCVVQKLGEIFGWLHPDWTIQSDCEADLAAWRPERREGKTMFWLADTVAPLLVRLHNEGVIDATAWMRMHVIPHLESPKGNGKSEDDPPFDSVPVIL